MAKATACPVFGGMPFTLVTLFVVPVLLSALMETKMRLGLEDEYCVGEE